MESETVATNKYLHSFSNKFPKPNQYYKVDSTIQSRLSRDYLPINGNLDSNQISNNYLEFILNSTDKEFFNFGKFLLELQVKIIKDDGSDLEDTDFVSVCDGFGHALISQLQVFINDTSIETSNYFGIWNVVKNYLSMDRDELATWGALNFYRNVLHDTIEENFFSQGSEAIIRNKCRKIIHMMVPIDIDLASADKYLLDNVNVRLRFDLNPAKFVLMTHEGAFKYKINLAKLHIEKVIPIPSSLLSLSKTLRLNNEVVEYVIDRPIIKTNVFPRGYTSLGVDNIFNGIIPSKFYFFIISQESLSGSFSRNPIYFQHCNMNAIRLEIDGHLHTSIGGDFTDKTAHFFVNTIINNDGGKSLITPNNFIKGKSIMVFDLRNSDRSDCLNIEKRGNLRLSLTLN